MQTSVFNPAKNRVGPGPAQDHIQSVHRPGENDQKEAEGIAEKAPEHLTAHIIAPKKRFTGKIFLPSFFSNMASSVI